MDINEQPLTKKQRRELKKQEKLEIKKQEKSKKMRTQIFVWIGIIIIVGAGIYAITLIDNSNTLGADAKIDAIDTTTDNTKGNPESDVVLIEYSDFQCPACASYQSIINDLMEEYNDDIYFSFRNFPLRSIHNNAQVAAQAAQAAAIQGKFWEMHDKLFENQSDWSSQSDPSEKFVSYAEEFELDIEKFKNDLGSDIVKDKVNNDYDSGIAAKVNSTPSFFLNGEKISPRTLDDFKEIIDKELNNSINADVSEEENSDTKSSPEEATE